jgi:uncharacterized membrane protein HdeD (DUF308 family)
MASFVYASDAGSLRRTWAPLVAWGTLVAALGIVVAGMPGLTTSVFVFMIGLASVIAGLVWMSWIVSVRRSTGGWWTVAFIPGALLLLFGAYALLQPDALVTFLFKAVALLAVLVGLADMIGSWRLREFFSQWWLRLVRGLLIAGAGIIVFMQPEAGTVTASLLIGLIFVAIGAMTIALGLAARRLPTRDGAVVVQDGRGSGKSSLPPV